MQALPVFGPPPARILCQSERGSCAACCGLYNFFDRSEAAERARLSRRTERVLAAFPDVDVLAKARDELLALESPELLSDVVKVCPFAGYVEPGRVGCLIHPARHPRGEDLRDLAVYPRAVCEGHFCAPHDWLRPREVALAQGARGTGYGRVVTDAGLVKATAALLDDQLGRPFTERDVQRAQDATASFWEALLAWPYADPDPRRFGGFYLEESGVERTLPSVLEGLDVRVSRPMRTLLDGLGSRLASEEEATKAVALLRVLVERVAEAMRD